MAHKCVASVMDGPPLRQNGPCSRPPAVATVSGPLAHGDSVAPGRGPQAAEMREKPFEKPPRRSWGSDRLLLLHLRLQSVEHAEGGLGDDRPGAEDGAGPVLIQLVVILRRDDPPHHHQDVVAAPPPPPPARLGCFS